MSDLPRLLLCSFDVIPGPSGSSRRLSEYLKALPDRFSVVVLSAKTPDHSHIEKYQGARLLRVPVGSGDLASRIQAFERAVRRQLESEDYALAHFTDPFGGYALCELKGDYGYRLIYEAQTFPSQELRYTHPQTEGDRRFLAKIRRQELFCLMNADLVVTGSQTTRAYIQSLGASEDQVRVFPAPVDLAPYTPDVLGVPDGEPLRMMYLGSQVGWQGLSTLLRAVALAARQEEVRLTVVGARHPDWQPHLDDLVKELGLGDRVEFQPPVLHDDLAKVLALADVGVLPLDDVERNRVQGGPLAKVSEYCAAGRPIIAADLPVTRELVPESAAVFFPPGNSEVLADRIIELARNVPRRLALGRAARAHAEDVLDAGLIRGKLLDLYDSLLEKRSEPVSTTSEDDLPMPTTVTGTPTNRLAALLPPEPAPTAAPVSKAKGTEAKKEAGPKAPSREELPLVMGQVLDEGIDTRLVKTELESNPIGPPVVMGAPLREAPSAATSGAGSAPEREAFAWDGRKDAETSSTAEPETTDEDGEASLPIVQATEVEPEEAPLPTPVVRVPPPPGRNAPVTGADASNAASSMPVVRVPPPPGRNPATSSTDASDASSTPVVKASTVLSRSASEASVDLDDASSTTPVVKAPAPLHRGASASSTDASDASSTTPIVKAPASLNRGTSTSGSDSSDASSATPIVKAPASLDRGNSASSADASDASSATPIVKAPALSTRSLGDDADEPPAPTPVVKAPSPSSRTSTRERALDTDETPEPPAPTPIIRVPTELLRELLPTRSSSSRGASTPSRPEEFPTPTPIVPAPSPLASRSISSRMETPVGRIASLPTQARTSSASDAERPPPVLRPSTGASEADRLPPIRGGMAASSSERERTPPTLRPSSTTSDTERPPALPPRAATPPPVPRQRPPRLQSVDGPPRLEPVGPPALKASATTPSGHDDEPEEISEDEAESIDDADNDTPSRARPQPEEPDEISSDEVEEAEISATGAAQLIDADDAIEDAEAESAPEPEDEGPAPEPVPSTLNPWFAQLAHGYCPPDGIRFDRHTPPTTFPGRDETTNPSHPSPSVRSEVVARGKSS
ncbi:glycosyltransferase [Myxococcus sp. Y35]|uniref:glycosyltransferase family 4 protein n=1 Tax=Pseudomyxococcus flavus TaxID=3115648 RepID=UPI003CF3328D